MPTQDLIERYKSPAKGEVVLTTVDYCAVSALGKTFNTQRYINPEILKILKNLADEIHEAGGKVFTQLTLCGYFPKKSSIKKLMAPGRLFNPYGFLSGLVFSKSMIWIK